MIRLININIIAMKNVADNELDFNEPPDIKSIIINDIRKLNKNFSISFIAVISF